MIGVTGRIVGARSGFSLIEVLIAVVVISLSLLGLAAVFPVVVFQQRVAIDRVQGAGVAESAEQWIRGHDALGFLDSQTSSTNQDSRGFEWLREAPDDPPFPAMFNPTFSPGGEWVTPIAGGQFLNMNLVTGDLFLSGESNSPGVRIPLSHRLVPSPYTRGAEPQFVWDVAMRRVLTERDSNGVVFATPDDAIEVAVFVRRVDTGIRVPRRARSDTNLHAQYGPRLRLSDVLMQDRADLRGADDLNTSEYRVPVSVESIPGADPGIGRPRNDGAVDTTGGEPGYGVPFVIPVETGAVSYGTTGSAIPRTRIPLDPGSAPSGGDPEALFELASQPRQKLVDGLGNVYDVVGVEPDPDSPERFVVVVNPPVPSSVSDPFELVEVVMTPQPPVAVRVFRVRK